MHFQASSASWLVRRLQLIACMAVLMFSSLALAQVRTESTQQPQHIDWKDFFLSPIGSAGVEFSETIRRVNGQSVTLVGYMVKQELPASGRFMLTPRPVQMSEHADGDADDLPPATVLVFLDPSQQGWTVPHVGGLIAVSGQLKLGRAEDDNGRVSWIRLQLGGEAVKSMSTMEFATYLHQLQHRH